MIIGIAWGIFLFFLITDEGHEFIRDMYNNMR